MAKNKKRKLKYSWRVIIRCILSLVMLAYLSVVLAMANESSRAERISHIDISIDDPMSTGFVSAGDIRAEVPALSATTLTRSMVNTHDIEQRIRRMSSVENVQCAFLNNGTLSIDVKPLIPVARVFPTGQHSYYINAQGKKVSANATNFVNVPIVSGYVSDPAQVVDMLPALRYIAADKDLDALVTSVSRASNGDIIIIPAVSGHVINIGDTTILADKFHRLRGFYKKVIPHRGWTFYDTISVKWRGRVTATRRIAKTSQQQIAEDFDDIVDDQTMLTVTDIDRAPEKKSSLESNSTNNKTRQ